MVLSRPDTLRPFSVLDAVRACQGTLQDGSVDKHGPLRVLKKTSHSDGPSFELVPYTGQPYVAISYCWASSDFQTIGISKQSTPIQTSNGVLESTHLSQFIARAAANYTASRPECAVWIDYHCINQSDPDEKAAQVAAMQRVYARAETTLVMLEDIKLTPDERATLRRYKGDAETARIVHHIISSRWFTRAWCSQELVLSRRAAFFLHDASDPDTPIDIDADSIWHAADVARNRDGSIPLFNVPRGLVPDNVVSRTSAYALNIVRALGCSDEYDKISLMCNLTRHVYKFAARPSAFGVAGKDRAVVHLNVLKMANVLAVARRDFSLLVANHGRNNPLQGHLGFGWAGYPVHNDRISEAWGVRNYEAHRDADARVDSGGALALRGIVARIDQEHVWEIHRDHGGRLHVSVDGAAHKISPEVEVHEGWTSTRTWQLLRDVLLGLAGVAAGRCSAEVGLHARIALGYVLAEPDYVEQPEPVRGDPLEVVRGVLGGSVGDLKSIATALECVRREEAVVFSTIGVSEGSVLLVSGNVREGTLGGRLLFQPFVVRPKVFSPPMVMTANSMVLESQPAGENAYRCTGCVRGLGMISEERGQERELRIV